MKLRVTPQARRHLVGIAEYFNERNPAAARRIRANIRKAFELLTHFPRRGRHGVTSGTHEILAPSLPYIIVYRIEADSIAILGIYHGAQLRPGQENPSDR
jgi:toxin ParE1/3/4